MRPLLDGDPRRIGPYTVLARIGEGGMGRVLLGRSPAGRLVAIKLVHAGLASDADFRRRFQREVAAARAVSGAFTAPVVDADPDAAVPWLVTTYLAGSSLRALVSARGPLPEPSVRALGAALAEALLSIHRAGIVHRDLTPSNVMLTPDGPRVIDFGIAHAAEASAVTRTGTAVGSPGYLPPERATGAETGPPGDVFSLGAVLVFAATGRGPFGEGPPHELLYRTVQEPPVLDGLGSLTALVAACLDKNPARRPTAEAVLSALAVEVPPQGVEWLPPDARAAVTRPVEIPTAAPAPKVSRRTLLLGGAGAAVLAGAAGVPLLAHGPSTRPDDWTYTPRGDLAGPVTVVGGLVLAVKDGGTLDAVDARTGTRRWTGEGLGLSSASKPSALVNGGMIVLRAESLFGLDPGTGKVNWHVFTEMPNDASPPALAGGHVYAFTDMSTLAAFDAMTGAQQFTIALGSPSMNAPTVASGVLYVVAGSEMQAIEGTSGRILWRTTVQTEHSSRAIDGPPVADATTVYTVTADSSVVALDVRNGTQRWRSKRFLASGHPESKAALGRTATTLYVITSEGRLVALDPRDGRQRWEYAFGPNTTIYPAESVPIEAGGLTFTARSGVLVALDTASGTVRWRFTKALSSEREQPFLAKGRLHILMGESVRSFDPATGRALRTRSVPDSQHLVTDGTALYVTTTSEVRALPA
ncbi:outer membrane protein assembly factor BamB family protein [Actinomadura rupiterrae]|uniref:outer membrane protein assembly factor BamB family protein n=1 Tax=Actinomadura rupiterrae TaxID=559627 RepID=UPI0020A393B8|nr:serine/threonine-protein kinase [Actinomadura rupiterrae]MCP2341779.1 outer membrane protein assembly factor BamB [Actinomadura rupiterrae]